ncbi:MAG: hypothetical protein JST22_02745 [Bacteroidetes bacterium]|nr:hypothetical protein [Bacteroidota bacterium]
MKGISFRSIAGLAGLALYVVGCTSNGDTPAPNRKAAHVAKSGSGISFVQGAPSPLDTSVHMQVDSPAVHATVQLVRSGNGAYFWLEANLQGFVLDTITQGTPPCPASSAKQAADSGRGNGQHLFVVVDEGPPRRIIQLPAQIPIEHYSDSGSHTIRIFMNRSWDEGLRQTGASRSMQSDLYCIRTFYIGANTGHDEVDTAQPLLTLNAPLDSTTTTYSPNSALMDFHLMFRTFEDGYRLEATLLDSLGEQLVCDTLNALGPYCISGLPTPATGQCHSYHLKVRVLDSAGNPVRNGARYDMNTVERIFCVKPI